MLCGAILRGPLRAALIAGAVGICVRLREVSIALVCLILSVFVTLTIASEFYRGARVIAARDGSNLLTAVGELTMRNTRRYGGYVVHFGMVLIFIGIAGSAFNQDIQMEMTVGQSLTIGPYTILCQNFDQPCQRELRIGARHAGSVPQRQVANDAVSRAAACSGEPGHGNDGRDRKHAPCMICTSCTPAAARIRTSL